MKRTKTNSKQTAQRKASQHREKLLIFFGSLEENAYLCTKTDNYRVVMKKKVFERLQLELRKTEEQIRTTTNNLFHFITLREKYKTERYEEMVSQVQNLLRRMKGKCKRLGLEHFNYLEPFQTVDDIPELPIVDKETYDNLIVPNLIRCGAIPKDGLIKGMRYLGSCRNATEATWNGEEFEYERCKFGTCYMDSVNHFQDDDGYDLFVPIKGVEE